MVKLSPSFKITIIQNNRPIHCNEWSSLEVWRKALFAPAPFEGPGACNK